MTILDAPQNVRIATCIYACGLNGNDSTLVSLLYAADGKGKNDPEVINLQTYLGATSPQWTAYVKFRIAPFRDQRKTRFFDETDAIFWKAWETVDLSGFPAGFRILINQWRTAKEAIRTAVSYPLDSTSE